jgi:oxygen-independent coproporphyrinogen-3 oxidase
VRYRNTPSPERYMAGWHEGARIDLGQRGELISEIELITPEIQLRERLMLGLRLAEGVDSAALERDTGLSLASPERQRSARRLTERGLLEIDGDVWRIPRNRWLLADGAIAQLI